VVIKPAEQTPLTLLELARDFEACGLPPGVINVVTGMGPECGGPIVTHPDIRKIAFTGSAQVGKLIMRNAADQLKRVSLELGGKSPNIFFADSDFEAAVDGALFGVFINQGEVCSAGSRVLVQKEIYQKFVEACAAKAKTIKVGPGIERGTKMGPLVSADQRDRVRKYQEIGKQEAKLAAGGGAPPGKGWYVEPTIFYDVDNNARIAQEEIFGPVMSVIPFNDEADALRIANATPYGLAAAVWTRDIFKAFRVVKQLEAGVVWVNHMQPTMLEAPWGGYKMSGFGRELGHWGVEEYLETKQIYVNLDETPIAWY
jgi:betaine-aldehyde dehydrogenase